jgi:hypothetical protein
MATAMNEYLNLIQNALEGALCLRHFPSEKVERHQKPEVEMNDLMPEKPGVENYLVLTPITITRGSKEKCLIEPSVNSTRVIFPPNFPETPKFLAPMEKNLMAKLKTRFHSFSSTMTGWTHCYAKRFLTFSLGVLTRL